MIRKVERTKLCGVKVIHLGSFKDHRGEYVETYSDREYRAAGIDVKFVQDDYSVSKRHVLRGIHGDRKTWKLISCPAGKLYLVVVNCDKGSRHFGEWASFMLSENVKKQVLIPPGYGNGHLVLSKCAIFQYKQSAYYDPCAQFSYRWDDPAFNIRWPVKSPILSKRDQTGAYV